MPKKSKVEFAAIDMKAESLSVEVDELLALVKDIDLDGPMASDIERLQRFFVLIARDATQAATQLYANLRVAKAAAREGSQ